MVSTLHSRAFCGAGFYLAKRVFPGFGSCNGHVTAITYGAELNVGGKSRTLGSVCFMFADPTVLCCSVVSVKHFNTVKSPTLRCSNFGDVSRRQGGVLPGSRPIGGCLE